MPKEQFLYPETKPVFELLEETSRRSGVSRAQAFEDFLHMSICALSGGQMEEQYLATVKRHTEGKPGKRGCDSISHAFGALVNVMEETRKDTEPLLTAGERVDAALAKLTAGRTFTDEQNAWITRLREHLIANLSIDQTDFDDLPVFSREGGWGRANRVFDDQLADLLKQINQALAA